MVLELRKLSSDEKIKQQMEARADYESRMATERGLGYREGEAKGLKEGIEKGIAYTLQRIVNTNIKKGRSIEDIADITGETVDVIKEIVEMK